VEREWLRYEGTAQRDLFRVLRTRFLHRHRPQVPGPILEVGPGPGRFSRHLALEGHALVLLELSHEAIALARTHVLEEKPLDPTSPVEFIRGDAVSPPFRAGAFAAVTLLGNVVGFAAEDGQRLLERACALVATGGSLLIEIAPGAGERSRYVHRLPPGAFARTLQSPERWVADRVLREGFDPQGERHKTPRFRRFSADSVTTRLERQGFSVVERLAVAPASGLEPGHLEAAKEDPVAWARLLALEETLGRLPERQGGAASVLLAARRVGEVEVPPERSFK
jgi:SAM-dependent methyltransferase